MDQTSVVTSTPLRLIYFQRFKHLAVFTVKDDGETYDTKSATVFDCDWVDSIMDEYSMEYPKANYQSTSFMVTIPIVH